MNTGFENLRERIGAEHVEARLRIEAAALERPVTLGYWEVDLKTVHRVMRGIERVLRLFGVWEWGRRHSVDYIFRENAVHAPSLPGSFRPFRVLHVSDLHIEEIADGGARLARLLDGVEADVLILTGDFRYRNWGSSDQAMVLMENIFDARRYAHGAYAVLGNHDTLDMVPRLESMGIRALLNEAVEIRRGGESVWIAGVDDPHYFRLHDVKKALSPAPDSAYRIFLAHSPEIAAEAAAAGADAYFCGHAHGGQICLPNGAPIIGNLRCPRRFFSGAWTEAGMAGYTTHGVGASGVPVRYFSRPEVVLHRIG